MHPVALVCTAVLGLLLFGLGLGVSILRFRERQGAGSGTDPANPLNKMIRAHGNTAEFAPFLAVLFLYLGAHEPTTATLWLMGAATACRCLLVIGLLAAPTMARPNPVRLVGALGTYVLGALLSLTLVRGLFA